MNILLNIDETQLADVVVTALKEDVEVLERLNDPKHVSVYDALMEVLAYYMTGSQLREYEARTVDPDWVNTMLQHDKQKVQEEMERGMKQVQAMFPGIRGIGMVL